MSATPPSPETGQIPLPPNSPVAIADNISRLPRARRAARFRLLRKDLAAAVFDALDPGEQRELLEGLRDPEAQRLISEMEPDDRVRLLDEMPAIVARRIISELGPAERERTNALLGYPPESAGRMMSPVFLELRPDTTAEQALATVREQGGGLETLSVLPVRDRGRKLEGVIRLTDLVRADLDAPISELVDRDYPSLSADHDQEAVARLIQAEDLLALPIVDREQRLIGIVTVDDAMEVLEREETEDIARIGASEPLDLPYHAVPVLRLVRARILWLLLLVAAATLTVSVLGAFEATLEQAVTLALFIPLLIGTGGNCGAQAATTVTRAIAVGDVRVGDLPAAVLKEARVGLLLGLLFAALGFPLVTAIWSADLATTVSISLLAICTWATTVGAALPLLSIRAGIDPAVVSAPLVTTLVDATGLLIYLSIAQLFVL